jgi:four helix bundle protein
MAGLSVVPVAASAEALASAAAESSAVAASPAAVVSTDVAIADAAAAAATSGPVVAVPSDEALDAVQLDASKLHCYQVALELHTQCSALLAFTHRVVRDQLERASLSVVLNTAEAGGRRSRRDKARYYAHARGSATEVAALLDVLERRRMASPAAIRTARRLAIRCIQMLTRVHKRLVG